MEQDHWLLLQQQYRKFGLVLCLGAGVSMDSGLPGWTELLENAAERFLSREDKEALLALPTSDNDARRASGTPLVDGLTAIGFSLPAIASLVEKKASAESPGKGREAFLTNLTDGLYHGLYARFTGLSAGDQTAERRLADCVRAENPTLAAVAAMVVVKDGPGFRPNPKVPAIINLNLDGVFRTYCRTVYGGPDNPLFRTIERASKDVRHGLTRYYHPHGFFPLRQGSDHSRDLVVFTEQDYFDFFNQPTGLFTYTMLSLLREYPVLFVGLSFRDDNLRRLLHYSYKERESHYRRDPGYKPRKREAKTVRHFAILPDRGRALAALVEASLLALGVQPLFVEEFKLLPNRLKEVYGEGWDSVYSPQALT
ncbi:MAG TPA: SIR2 family protein [Bryobacteraceae bacterium]|nr:SIR2 family protein [Bryobacteraceae bacterium]